MLRMVHLQSCIQDKRRLIVLIVRTESGRMLTDIFRIFFCKPFIMQHLPLDLRIKLRDWSFSGISLVSYKIFEFSIFVNGYQRTHLVRHSTSPIALSEAKLINDFM